MTHRNGKIALASFIIAGLVLPQVAFSQTGAAAPAVVPGPKVGEVAPDFALAGATRYGVLKSPVRLSDFRGRTVVLAFFAQARTKG
jgi:hypothetical protein